MADVRTHLLRAKEEVRLGLIGALEEQYAELVPQLAAMYSDLTEKLKVVRADFGHDDDVIEFGGHLYDVPCLLYTSPSPRDGLLSRMPSSA